MIVPHEQGARVTLAVVSLGTSAHLEKCFASLAAHVSATPFRLVWVDNSVRQTVNDIAVPAGTLAVHLDTNLGWAGGLHVARANSDSEYLVWVQEDMEVCEGWLDALVTAADENPQFAALGSLAVDASGAPHGIAAGRATPHDDVAAWNQTNPAPADLPVGPAEFDWITSKGMLTRTSAWDAIGGPDPRLYPLNHVDKQYATHLRAHGFAVALVPAAKLVHVGSQASPSRFRTFLADWQEADFNADWGPVVASLAVKAGPVDHPCAPWRNAEDTVLESAQGAATAEAALMLVPFARWMTATLEREKEELRQRLLLEAEQEAQRFRSSTSWRLTAPLRAISDLVSRARR